MPLGYQTDNPVVCVFKGETKGGAGHHTPDPTCPGGLWAEEREHGQRAVPDSCVLVLVVGGLSMVAAAVVVVVVATVVAMVVGATVGMVGTVVASVAAAVAVASVLLTAPVAPTVVGGNVGGAERKM